MRLLRKFILYFNLAHELDDYNTVHIAIEKDIIFKGTNLWILMFATVVASIGLNMNSTAVIIGAMLISPLMGPINGMGYSIATFNFPMFRKSVKNFTFAVVSSLIASTTYFIISPVSTAHSELLARTSPTIYDVLIALFGGMAGIVAISSRQKGNVIPGVAIATALMPPLCTAGYGLATAQLTFFLGALYLFTINTVFIAIASIVFVQMLNFPIHSVVNANQKRKVNRWITAIIVITIIPSIYFGYALVMNEQFANKANSFISDVNLFEGNYLLKSHVIPEKRIINLVYGGNILSDNQKENIRQKAKIFNIEKATINIEQGIALGDLSGEKHEAEALKLQINNLSNLLATKSNYIDSLHNSQMIGRQMLKEINLLFPSIKECSVSDIIIFNIKESKPQKVKLVLLNSYNENINMETKQKIKNWLQIRLNTDNISVIYK